MLVYTVTLPIGTNDNDFADYTHLLEEVGIDVSNAPRVLEPKTSRKWLYAWTKKEEAERFTLELRRRTRNNGWYVQQVSPTTENRGPVAPLEVATVPEADQFLYYLIPSSRERVIAAYPKAKLVASVAVPVGEQQDQLPQRGTEWWEKMTRELTGLGDEQIDSLGGVRVLGETDKVAYQRLPVTKTS